MSHNKKKIKVLYVIWSLGLGGAEQVVINLAKGLDKNSFLPIVCCLNGKGVFAESLESIGIKVVAIDKRPGLDLRVLPKLIKIIRENKIDIVHTHLWGANFWGRIAAFLSKTPVCATEHNMDVWKKFPHICIDKLLAVKTNKIVAVSESVKEFYISKGIDPGKISVIYNGIDTSGEIEPGSRTLRDEFAIPKDDVLLAIIGRLVEQKGHKVLFDALRILPSGCKVSVLVVGSGPLSEELKACSSDLPGVKFTGLRKDIKNILQEIDFLLLPSLREGLPMIVLEAMAAGKPVIASRVGGTGESISDGVNGILIEPGNARELSLAISRLVENSALVKQMGAAAVRQVRELFSLGKMVSRTETLYLSLIKEKTV